MEQTAFERTLGIGDFWRIFKRAFIFMLLAGILFTALHVVYSRVTYAPVYVSDGKINTMRRGATTSEGATSSHPGNEMEYALFVQTQCVELMKTRQVRLAVLKDLKLEGSYSVAALASAVKITPIENTSLIGISATAGTPELAQEILDSYMRHSIIVLEENKLSGTAEGMGWVVDEASLPTVPVNSPSSFLSLVIGFVAAVLVYIIFAIRYIINDFAVEANDVAASTGLPLLGAIPDSRSPRFLCSTLKKEEI